jgi:hypothetical protein
VQPQLLLCVACGAHVAVQRLRGGLAAQPQEQQEANEARRRRYEKLLEGAAVARARGDRHARHPRRRAGC